MGIFNKKKKKATVIFKDSEQDEEVSKIVSEIIDCQAKIDLIAKTEEDRKIKEKLKELENDLSDFPKSFFKTKAEIEKIKVIIDSKFNQFIKDEVLEIKNDNELLRKNFKIDLSDFKPENTIEFYLNVIIPIQKKLDEAFNK